MSAINTVSVIGAGNMGHGIAEVVALSGYDVTLRDVEDDLVQEGYENIKWSLEKLDESGYLDEPPGAVLDRIETAVDLEVAVMDADLVVEAAPERMEIKQDLFTDFDVFAPADAILASNTSSLSITEIASATQRPAQVVGMHFFNPPVKMELVEVVSGAETSSETVDTATAFVESLEKTPILVRKDIQGFVVNNVLLPFMMEPAWMLSNDETSIEQADAAMVHQRGYPMGPFELADLTGLDIGHDVYKEDGRPVPSVLEEMVQEGALGKKTGRGYYAYEDGDGADYEPRDGTGFDTLRVEARMINAAARLVDEDVATPEAVDTGMRLGAGFPQGVCRRADQLGIDVVLGKLESLATETGAARYEPASFLRELVETGRTGEAMGAGFYEYDEETTGYQHLNYELDDGNLAIELDRPEQLNALSTALRADIDDLLGSVDLDTVRCVTIEGAGSRAFSAGADINEFEGSTATDAMHVTPVFETVNDFPRPIIAKIDGFCLGAGFELALACDLRIATEDAEFGFPEIDLGLLPGGGGTQRLVRLVGATRTKELVYRGNRIDATRAAEWGIVNRVVPSDEFAQVVEEFVTDITDGPPVALEVSKRVVNEGAEVNLAAGLVMESQGFGLLMGTDDATEGTDAFLNNRSPEFEGK